MARVKLSPPWCIFYREVNALFERDPEVHVVYDEDDEIIKVYVENPEKAEILAGLLPETKTFGRVSVSLQVIPADGRKLSTELPTVIDASTFTKAFEGNGAFSYAKTFKNVFQYEATYVVFQPDVVQFFADDISDINGLRSTLYEEVAKDVFGAFEGAMVNFCTDKIR